MVKSERTMLEIADAFLELLETKPYGKITIGAIVEQCGKNRKTFYYHFVDKEHLLVWIFRRDLALLLQDAFEEDRLVYWKATSLVEDEALLECSDFPYYVHNETGFCTLDHSAFFICFAKALDAHRNLYSQYVKEGSPNILVNHFYSLYPSAIYEDVVFILGNRFLDANNTSFLADFYSTAFISILIKAVYEPSSCQITDTVTPLGNLIHDSIRREIEERRLNRGLRR